MLPRTLRLIRPQLHQVLSSPVRYSDENFMLLHRNNDTKNVLFSVHIGKKISKSAVIRNNNKRRISEALIKISNQIVQGTSCAVMLKRNFSKIHTSEINSLLIRSCAAAGILKKS